MFHENFSRVFLHPSRSLCNILDHYYMCSVMLLSVASFLSLLTFSFSFVLEVKIKQGVVRGKLMTSCHDVEFFAFLGVPYAKPPVGAFRFKDSQPLENQEHAILDATSEAPPCLQQDFISNYTMIGREDCLYLNVFTNKLPQDSDDLRSVMVWIHGGAFMWGSASTEIYGPDYFMDKDIVLVTVQYRLGAIGFLNSGNYGLKDQVMALRWIQENIAAFGGSPQSVTLFGESAGGASVHFHMLSPMSKGLFHRAISQSGTALCTWGYVEPEQAIIRTRQLAKFLDCPNEPAKEMMACIESKESREIVKQHQRFLEFGIDPETPFGPTVETFGNEIFLPEEPYQRLEGGQIEPVPWLVGMNQAEGAYSSAVVMGDVELVKKLQKNILHFFPITLDYKHLVENHDHLTTKIYKYYFGNRPVSKETIQNLTDMYSDRHYFHGIYEAVRLHALTDAAPVFWYKFNHRREKFSISSVMGDAMHDYGACHADDLQYLFSGNTFPAFEEGEAEKVISETILELWVNFAKYGNPTPDGSKMTDVSWKPVKPQDMTYMDIGLKLEMNKDFPFERMAFWSSLPLYDSGRVHGNSLHNEL